MMKYLMSLALCIVCFGCKPYQFKSLPIKNISKKPTPIEPSTPSEPSIPSNPNIKSCEEDVSFCPTEQLCLGGIGAGRKIYVIISYEDYIWNMFNVASVKQNLNEIKDYTGIDHDTVRYDPKNSPIDTQNLKNNEYDAIWIIGGTNSNVGSDLLSVLKDKVKQGVGLVLLGDNDIYSKQVDAVLGDIKPDWNLKFDTTKKDGDEGLQLVAKGNTGSKVLYDHPVTSGLYKDVSEGNTISYLLPRDSSKSSIIDNASLYKPIILNSSAHISVAAVEEELSDGMSGYSKVRKKNGKILQRTLMHGGFTSLFRVKDSWGWKGADSSTAHFFYNIACWSAGAQ